MTTYRQTVLPDVPAVWLLNHPEQGPGPHRVTRWNGEWRVELSGELLDDAGLLALGEVSDVHPDLPVDAPLPWTWDGGQIEDANGQAVAIWANHAPFIVKAANAYGEQVAGDGEWASKADRALAQERARADAAEAEVIRRGNELAAVLGEVRALLDRGAFSPEYIVARNALRERLDGA